MEQQEKSVSNPKVFGEKSLFIGIYAAAQLEEQKGVNIYELPSIGDRWIQNLCQKSNI